MRRILLVLFVATVAAMFYFGWLSFQNDGTRSSITIEKEEIRADTGQAVDTARDELDDAVQSLKSEENRE